MTKVYGYVRVSSADQNEDRQMIEMQRVGVPDANIFMPRSTYAGLFPAIIIHQESFFILKLSRVCNRLWD